MKKTLKYILVAVFATMFAAPAFADKDPKEAIKTKKNIIEDANGNLKLRLETFVTGDGENRSQIVTTINPMDVVLVLDHSLSMGYDRNRMGTIRLGSVSTLSQDELRVIYKRYQNGIRSFYNRERGNDYTYTSSETLSFIERNGSIVVRNNNQDYKGTIYTDLTRLEAMKEAVDLFVDIVALNASQNDGVEHNIAVVQFSTNDDTHSNTLQKLGNDYAAIKKSVYGIKDSGTTYPERGMRLAKEMLNAVTRNSTKVVLFFTDGTPGGTSYVKGAADGGLKESLEIKQAGATVYSVGLLDSDDLTAATKMYMHLMSSNNTTVGSMPSSSRDYVAYEPSGYYLLARNTNELNSAFESVSKEIGQGGDSQADYVLEASSTVLRDIITPSFQIPEGGKVSFKVSSVKKLETTSISDNADLTSAATWEAERDTTMTNAVVQRVDPATGNTYVDVKGFDFNANWVGYVHKKVNGTETKKWLRGNKLVMYIDIEPSAENEGGAMQTNAEGSGILINGNEVVPFDVTPVQDYVNNDLVTVRQVNLTIKKSGLQPGESVIYFVTRNNDSSFKRTVVLTAGADGTAEGKVKVDAWPNVNKSSLYTYTVTEDTTWAYEYKASAAQSHTLYDSSLKLTNVFTFGPSEESGKSSSSASRGEDAKNNVFSR